MTERVKPARRGRPAKQKKKVQRYYGIPRGKKGVFLVFDVETTGSKRNWDIAIMYYFIVCDEAGTVLGRRLFRVNPGHIPITYAAYCVHGITAKVNFPHVCSASGRFFTHTHYYYHRTYVTLLR